MTAAINAEVNTLTQLAAKARKVSAVQAKLAWEKEQGVFVDLRVLDNSITLEGFERIPAAQLAKNAAKLTEAATAANTKDIYLIDATGFQSGLAAHTLSQLTALSGYNVQAIDGGLTSWLADNGPFKAGQPEVEALRTKILAEINAPAGQRNPQAGHQILGEIGFTFPDHQLLSVDLQTNDVIEHLPDYEKLASVDQSLFQKWVNKMRL